VRLVLSPNCPIFGDAHRHDLTRLLDLIVYKRWHLVAKPDVASLQAIVGPELWKRYGDTLRHRYKLAINEKSYVFSPALCAAGEPGRLVDYLEFEVTLLLENATTDGTFFRAVLANLRPSLLRLFNHPRVIAVRQAGGIGELKKEAEREMDYRAPMIPLGAPARVIAIADSDAPSPGAPCRAARDLANHARTRGYSVHVLRKRSIENYVPDAPLLEYRDKRADIRAAIDVVLGLDDVARDHYPMKKESPDVSVGR
jgi:hypothetical protein